MPLVVYYRKVNRVEGGEITRFEGFTKKNYPKIIYRLGIEGWIIINQSGGAGASP